MYIIVIRSMKSAVYVVFVLDNFTIEYIHASLVFLLCTHKSVFMKMYCMMVMLHFRYTSFVALI